MAISYSLTDHPYCADSVRGAWCPLFRRMEPEGVYNRRMGYVRNEDPAVDRCYVCSRPLNDKLAFIMWRTMAVLVAGDASHFRYAHWRHLFECHGDTSEKCELQAAQRQ